MDSSVGHEYEQLQRNSLTDQWSDECKETPLDKYQRDTDASSWSWRLTIALILLAVSLLANTLLLFQMKPGKALQTSDGERDCASTHAGLKRNVPIPIHHATEYSGDNLTEVTALWEELSGDPGVVALPETYTKQTGLPHAMRFPWDQDRGVYLLQSFHDLHCLRTLFRYVMYTETKQPQHIALSHALHCLDQLRQQVLCNADDTPRYAGFQDPPGTGSGQDRMCRDWQELGRWAEERTACFKHEDEVAGPMIERFKSCSRWPRQNSTTTTRDV